MTSRRGRYLCKVVRGVVPIVCCALVALCALCQEADAEISAGGPVPKERHDERTSRAEARAEPRKALVAGEKENQGEERGRLGSSASIQGLSGTAAGDIRNIRWGRHGNVERIVFDLYEQWQGEKTLSKPGGAEVEYESHPHRLVVRLKGVWSVSAALRGPKNSSLIRSVYRVPGGDGSVQLFVVSLKVPVSYKVLALEDPARVAIDMSEQRQVTPERVLYSLRTSSYRETTYRLWETLTTIRSVLSRATGGETVVIQSKQGTYFVEEGLYATKEEAEDQRRALLKEGYQLHVEKRAPGEIPEALFQ